MSYALRPRANCISTSIQQSKRTISQTPSRPASPSADEAISHSVRSSRSETVAFLRTQNDIYLAKLKRRLEYLSQVAESIHAVVPELAHRSALIRIPRSSASHPNSHYTVDKWKVASKLGPPVTQTLRERIERVVKNIEDLEKEPYRADVTPSKQEEVQAEIQGYTKAEKESNLKNADFEKAAIEARFDGGVQLLKNRVEEMEKKRKLKTDAKSLRDREKSEVEESGRNEVVGKSHVGNTAMASTASSMVDGPAVSYNPLGNADVSAPKREKTEGWGGSATKIEKQGKHHSRIENPFSKNAPPALQDLQKELEDTIPKTEGAKEADATATEVKMDVKPKPSLFERQRMMDASQVKRG